MARIRVKNSEKAQGLLEFALVLPILLLVILGIFAFGHLFFAYTSVVSASREAARYGAVVGEGMGGVPRYQDCTGIRAAAERVGTFAGVHAVQTTGGYVDEDPGIYIGYDEGPTSNVYGECTTSMAIDPATNKQDVELGDRILVRVSIDYEPIVPIVEIPSFPLTATTARTIIRDVAVGTAPPAQTVCETAVIDLDLYWEAAPDPTVSLVPPYELVVGQVTFPLVQLVTSDNNPNPPGTIRIYDREAYLRTPTRGAPFCQFAPPTNAPGGVRNTACDIFYPSTAVDGYDIVIDYEAPAPTVDECYLSTTLLAHVEVVPAVTEIVLGSFDGRVLPVVPPTYSPGSNVQVNFEVRTNTPGGGQPVGKVEVYTVGGGTRNLDCSFNSPPAPNPFNPMINSFSGYCSLGNRWDEGQTYFINARFIGETGRYLNDDTVSNYPSALGFPYTIPVQPIGDAQWCQANSPKLGGISFASDSFSFGVTNNSGVGLTLTSISLNWPNPGTITGVPFLYAVTFGSNTYNVDLKAPPSHYIGGLDTLMPSGNTWTMQARYNEPLASGDYTATLQFSGRDKNGDPHSCTVTATRKKN